MPVRTYFVRPFEIVLPFGAPLGAALRNQLNGFCMTDTRSRKPNVARVYILVLRHSSSANAVIASLKQWW